MWAGPDISRLHDSVGQGGDRSGAALQLRNCAKNSRLMKVETQAKICLSFFVIALKGFEESVNACCTQVCHSVHAGLDHQVAGEDEE